MKKYICLALLAFFGVAILSPVMAIAGAPDASGSGSGAGDAGGASGAGGSSSTGGAPADDSGGKNKKKDNKKIKS